MTTLQLERKLDGKCIRCGELAGDTNLCEKHRTEQNARTRRSMRTARSRRRLFTLSIAPAI